ncbi:helix-turn-helix transcriptional regulator [Nonomuraea fuscirosea]|uniref:helix-turn-helix transcriptional regulator n=1 Tax=Nonomuraea fuscirosea TaxID=1291556 RepID=UPI0011B289CB|nr:helix-turn-helix transcriptional regulator [Nonomuraea fuscirosea]
MEDLRGVVDDPEQTLEWLRGRGFVIGQPARARRPRHALSPAVSEATHTLDRLKALVHDLDTRYQVSGHYQDAAEPVSKLTSREEVTQVFDALQRTVRQDWMQLVTGPFFRLAEPLRPERSVIPSTTLDCRRRVVYEREVMEDPLVMEGLRNTLRWGGAQIRFTDQLPTKLLIVDNAVAMTPLEERGSLPMLLIEAPSLINGQIARFEEEWEKATPWNADVSSAPPDLDEQDRKILQQVVAGETDKAIARVCQSSMRTVGRRIARMRQLAGVSTRTQLVHYATKHWL